MKTSITIMILFLNLLLFSADLSAAGKAYISSLSGLRLREKSDLKSSVIELIPFGREVKIIKVQPEKKFISGRYGHWTRIATENSTGWVFGGFLCEFNPLSLKNRVADHYKSYYKQKYNESEFKTDCDKALFNYSNDEIIIQSIADQYILLTVPSESTTGCEAVPANALWKYDKETRQFHEIFHEITCSPGKLLYLNNDEFPDLIQYCGCCGDITIDISLGTGSGFDAKNSISYECNEYYLNDKDVRDNNKYGKCGSAKIHCGDYEKNEYLIYQFNCSTNKFDIIKREGIRE